MKRFMVLICALAAIACSSCKKDEVIVNGLVAERTMEDIILSSDVIVTGTVSDILDSKWSNEGFVRGDNISNVLQTDIIVDVDEVLEGEPSGDSVTVRIDKGEDEDTVVISDGYPDFEIDEKVLLFLSRDDGDVATDEDYYVLTGMWQGKFTLPQEDGIQTMSEGEEVYTNSRDTLNMAELPGQIDELIAANPNFKEEKAQRQKEIEEANKLLFGE